MKPCLITPTPSKLSLSLLLSTLTSSLQFLSSHPFSSSTQKTKWNSKTNTIITHPLLLLMESCTSMSQLKQIQALMTKTALITHTFPVSRVLAFCALAESGDLNYAHLLFQDIPNPNTYMWNLMIRGYSKAKLPLMGFCVFREMVRKRVGFDSRSFVFGLKACEQLLRDFEGRLIHCLSWKMGFFNYLLVQNGFVYFYGFVGCLVFARKVFDEIAERDAFSWTSMIGGYSLNGYGSEALKLFDLMLCSDVQPNEVTGISVLSSCSSERDLQLGKRLHEYVKERKLNCSLNLMNALLGMYVRCCCLASAREIFDELENKDVFSWTTMVYGYANDGEIELARRLFNEMPEKNVVSWNAMIAGYSQNNQPREALELFREMVDAGHIITENTLVCILSACGQLGCLQLGHWIYCQFVEKSQIDLSVVLTNALIDMYAKCGVIQEAEKLFNQMSERDLVSWNTMIAAYASHGQAKQALTIFERMLTVGFRPDDVTFVGMLSACSHGGLVKDGREYFQTMESKHNIKPKREHYACIIDLLGRVGLLNEAYELITQMPVAPNEAVWGALLNACRMHGNVELAKLAACKLFKLDPEDSGVYIQLATVCANARRWEDARTVRSMMRETRVKKTPGHSLIEIDGVFHEFLAGDNSHRKSEDIYGVLNEIILLTSMEEHKKFFELTYLFQMPNGLH